MIFAIKRMELSLLLLSLWATALVTTSGSDPEIDDGDNDYGGSESGSFVVTPSPLNKTCPQNGGARRREDGFKDICNLVYSADANGDKLVTEAELVNKWMKRHLTSTRALARAHYALLNMNNDDNINEDDDVLLFNLLDFQRNGEVPTINYWLQYKKLRAQAPFVVLREKQLYHGEGRLTKNKFRNLFKQSTLRTFSSDISRSGFIKLMSVYMDRTIEEAKFNFLALDHNHDGWITGGEMDALFQALDTDGTGDLDAHEVSKMANVLPKYLTTFSKEIRRLEKIKQQWIRG